MLVRPHRGNTVGAAAVVLAAFVVEVELRLDLTTAARLGLTATLALLTGVLAWGSPREAPRLRAYQEVLHALSGLALVAATAHLTLLVAPDAEAALVVAVAAAAGVPWVSLAVARGSVLSLLVRAVLVAVTLAGAAVAVSAPDAPLDVLRWALLAMALGLVPAILVRLDHRYREAVVLADVLAAVAIALGASFLLPTVAALRDPLGLPAEPGGAAWGWEALLLSLGFVLVGLSSAVREQGPGWLGAIALLVALAVVADGGDGLLGWPALLLGVGLLLLVVGLRPVRHAVRDPDEVTGRPEAEPVPLRRPVLLPPPEDR